MKIQITFEADNAAFDEYGSVEYVLNQALDKFSGQLASDFKKGEYWPLRDLNGNNVGKVEIK